MIKFYLEKAIEASIFGGKEILQVYKQDNYYIENKSDNSPLTIADKKSHEKICDILKITGIPILSEESKHIDYDVRKNWKKYWLVDPLDGTKEFIKKNGDFTVNIALIEEQKPVLGVIFVPVTNELYFSVVSEGAYKINVQSDFNVNIELAEKLPLKIDKNNYVVVASRSHLNEQTENFINELKKTHENLEIMSRGSSLKICMVAEGRADIYPRFGPTMEWDIAAGHAIAIGANCQFKQTDNLTDICYNKEDLLNPYFIVSRK